MILGCITYAHYGKSFKNKFIFHFLVLLNLSFANLREIKEIWELFAWQNILSDSSQINKVK